MRALVIAILVAAAASIAAAQRFIGIDDDPQLGDRNAKVTIIEFGDYQCPVCRQFWREVMPRLKKQYIETGKVRLVFRDFPLDSHPDAVMAAMAADCAADQGKYFEYHDKLFHEQDRRGRDVVRFRSVELKRWAAEIGIDAAPFAECLDSGRHKDEVMKDYRDATDVGLGGTPAFFINGRLLAGSYPLSTFQKIIEDELKK